MSAALPLLKEGLRLSLVGNDLKVKGLADLEPEQKGEVLTYARTYKEAIIAELQAEALAAYRQLQGLMREHAGCRIHVYTTKPEPQFTLRQPPEWYADGFAEVVFDLFLKAAGIIGQELRTAGAVRF